MRDEDIAVLDGMTLSELEAGLDHHTRKKIPVSQYTAFSWSASRHHTFQRCKRQYYLNYYGSRSVRDARHEAVGAVWWLKQVTTPEALRGSVIHSMAGRTIRAYAGGEALDPERSIAEAVSDYVEAVEASRRGRRHNKSWVILMEHIYGDASEIDSLEDTSKVEKTARAFFESEAFRYVMSQPPDSIIEVDEPFQSFTIHNVTHLGDVRVFAIPDLVLQIEDRLSIIDWKTGDVTHESLAWQAAIYRMYAAATYGIPADGVAVWLADISGDGKLIDPPGQMPSVKETEHLLLESIGAMVDLMEDPAYNTAPIRNFPMTDNLNICRGCGFKRACWRHEST